MKTWLAAIAGLVVAFAACRSKEPALVELSAPSLAPVEEVVTDPNSEVPEGWVELTEEDGFVLDIRYATTNNFTGQQQYPCARCFLREDAANAIKAAQRFLTEKYNLTLKLYDCYRPLPIQENLWAFKPDASYVTPPAKGSMHNRGMALDLTIVDSLDFEWDMGTNYDYFGVEAHMDYTELDKEVLDKRLFLKDIMAKYGFQGIRTEWWHYALGQGLDPVSKWEWSCPTSKLPE